MSKIANLGLHTYCPEMGQKKPIGEMEARLTYNASHWIVTTPLELKGRGITHESTYTKDTIVGGENNPKIGWKVYRVTKAAFETLKTKHAIVKESLLD